MPETCQTQPPVPAIETAAALYAERGLVLGYDIEQFLRHRHGVVVKRPDLMLLARPVVLDDPDTWLRDPGQANAWLVHFLAGNVRVALLHMPHELPYLCWHREFRAGPGGRLHVVPTRKFINKYLRHG